MNKSKRGISLIVLVITIIVIIILAAAVILTINNNNPMDNANKARYTSDRANVQDALTAAIGKIAAEKLCSVTIPAQTNIATGIEYTLTGANDGVIGGKIGWDTLATDVPVGYEKTTMLGMKLPNYGSGTRWFVNSNGDVFVEVAGVIYGPSGMTGKTLEPGVPASGDTNYTVNGKTAVIPNGFYVSTKTTEQSIDGGLVVIAPDTSEFVWVPVDNISEMFSGSSGAYVGILTEYVKDGNKNGKVIDPIYREPAQLDNALYDNNTENLADINSILNKEIDKPLETGIDLQSMMQGEVNEMYVSIAKNKGFYIGRYETGDLSKEKVVSNVANNDISDQTWYTMFAKQKKYATVLNTGIRSSMIYGSQWDAVMRWFAKDEKTAGYITNASGEKGNWNKIKKATGASEYPVKNIYDMAGNVSEWTAEAVSDYCRTLRGGDYTDPLESRYTGYRNSNYPTYKYIGYGSRLTLYL